MTRKILLWTVMVVAAAVMVMNTNTRARHEENRLAEIQTQIELEKSRIRVLNAEWSMLRSPERLEQLAARYLVGYGRVSPKQLASADMLDIKLGGAQPTLAQNTPILSPNNALKAEPHTTPQDIILQQDDVALLIDEGSTPEEKTLLASVER